jgi:hypothetical protein
VGERDLRDSARIHWTQSQARYTQEMDKIEWAIGWDWEDVLLMLVRTGHRERGACKVLHIFFFMKVF